MDRKLIEKLDTLEKVIEGNRKHISDTVKKMYPVPSPAVVDLVDRQQIEPISYIRSRSEIVKIMIIKIPKKFRNLTAKDKKIRDDGVRAIWSFTMNSDVEGSLGSIKETLFGVLDDYVFIKVQSDKGRLYFDL